MFQPQQTIILMADDDPDDREMVRDALEEAGVHNELRFVENGEQLLAYLRSRPPLDDAVLHPRPGLILLDLNMPKLDGREALAEIKQDPDLKSIPIVVFTTSQEEGDVSRAYDLGVNSFISKPATFDRLVDVMKTVAAYWLDVVSLPPQHGKKAVFG